MLETNNLIVGKRIKELREDNDFTQQNIADKLKISRRTYQKYEAGEIELGVKEINYLADLYKCTSDYILGRTTHTHEGIFEFSKDKDKFKVIYDKREFKDMAANEILNKIKEFIDKEIE